MASFSQSIINFINDIENDILNIFYNAEEIKWKELSSLSK
jgi:hypothetical protein